MRADTRITARCVRLFLGGIVSLLLCACTTQPAKEESLYARLGGEPGIASLVNGLLLEISGDDRIRHHFKRLHLAGFRSRLVVHFCDISGGPCRFDGRTMRQSHRFLDISAADFNALVEDLIDAMDALSIRQATQNEFLAKLAPMRRNIVIENVRETGRPASGAPGSPP